MSQKTHSFVPVAEIPASARFTDNIKVSKYEEVFNDLQSLELHKPVQIDFPGIKPMVLYSSLKKKIDKRRVKNVRLVVRNSILFAEKLF